MASEGIILEENQHPIWDYVSTARTTVGEAIPVVTVPLIRSIAVEWHTRIQPFVKSYSKRTRYRADEKWNWPRLLALPYAAALIGSRCWGTALMVEASNGDAVPVLLSLLFEPVAPAELNRRGQIMAKHDDHLYTWFLATAPREALMDLGVPILNGAGGLGIDGAIVASGQRNLEGRIWLHAADCGGHPESAKGLFEFYHAKCGLTAVGGDAHYIHHAPLPLPRKNDGRHFRADERLARKLYTQRRSSQ